MKRENYWTIVWREFKKSWIGMTALCFLILFFLIGLYAPLFASSKPLVVLWDETFYFPLFRYLFYKGYYSKPIDLFFNLLMFTLPILFIGLALLRGKGIKFFILILTVLHLSVFFWILTGAAKDPGSNPSLQQAKNLAYLERLSFREDPLLTSFTPRTSWLVELGFLPKYSQLNQLLSYKEMKGQHQRLIPYLKPFENKTHSLLPTLWRVWERNENEKRMQLKRILEGGKEEYLRAFGKLPVLLEAYRPFSHSFIMAKYEFEHAPTDHERMTAQYKLNEAVTKAGSTRSALADARRVIESYRQAMASLNYLQDKNEWLENESQKVKVILPPLFRNFHWEDDAGGTQTINQYVPWWELTRVNRKDLVASLLFGIRISVVVGMTAVVLSLLIGIPLGTISGYFAGKTDLVICRFIEVWEAMPTFFMLLLIIAITQSKSIFLVIGVLGIFGWTGIARFIRSEALKQRNLPYVLSCKTLGYTHPKIMFSHILPNAIPPILTLVPFSMMAAITSEAGLSFLGLGEEGSTSWGVLMDEGRSVFPSESYLLWPPAILLTLLLISIALVGDTLRDAIDPKMRN